MGLLAPVVGVYHAVGSGWSFARPGRTPIRCQLSFSALPVLLKHGAKPVREPSAVRIGEIEEERVWVRAEGQPVAPVGWTIGVRCSGGVHV